jgi:hypothetical protein
MDKGDQRAKLDLTSLSQIYSKQVMGATYAHLKILVYLQFPTSLH